MRTPFYISLFKKLKMRTLFFFIFLSSVFFVGCKKNPGSPDPTPTGILPTITTSAISLLTTTSAVSGGNVSSDGGSAVTERGVCWSTTSNPIVTGNHTADGSGTGIFTSNITGLSPNTTYYLRAYAKNTQGLAYGNEVLFQTITPPAPGDSASLIFINAVSSTTGRSFITYDAFKNKIWEIPNFQSIDIWNTPTYFNGKLYVASSTSMMSLNAPNGAVNWTYANGNSLINPELRNDTLITASSVIAPSANNAILLIDKNSGNVIWSKVVTEQPVVTPILSDGKIYNLTTNAFGGNTMVSAYDVVSKNLIWQKLLTNSYLRPLMIVRNDSLIVMGAATVHVFNKNTGATHWIKTISAQDVYLYKNNLAFRAVSSGRVSILSLQTGNIILESNPIGVPGMNLGTSYTYNDAFYCSIADSIFCISLIDGSEKWRKKYVVVPQGTTFRKFIAVGNTVYGSREYDFGSTSDESKLMILNALDFTIKDSIIVPKRDVKNFSILSSAGKFY
jgi:hypothetical protein